MNRIICNVTEIGWASKKLEQKYVKVFLNYLEFLKSQGFDLGNVKTGNPMMKTGKKRGKNGEE